MKEFVITCCSTADLPEDYLERREIPYVCFHFTIDGVEYADDLGKSMPFEDFYKHIENGAMPTTSQVNIGQFIDFFEPFLKDGKDILHISISSGVSGTYESALAAQKELAEKYPDRKLFVVDSLAASSGYGLLIDTACDLRDAGSPIEHIHEWVEENKLTLHHWFTTTDLTHLRRGGRISATSAAFGSLLNICPIMNVDVNGNLTPRIKVRGKTNALKGLVKCMEEHAEGGLAYNKKCFISQSASYNDARFVADLVEETFPSLNGCVMINNIGTAVGSHTGPGTIALFFYGDKRID